MVRDSQLIRWFRDLLINNTAAMERVYAWRRTPSTGEETPIINITLDKRVPERQRGDGAYKTDRRLCVILLVRGVDEEDQISEDDWVIDRLDDLEQQVLALVDYDHMPPDAPAGIFGSMLSEVITEREETNRIYAARYLIFSILTADAVQSR